MQKVEKENFCPEYIMLSLTLVTGKEKIRKAIRPSLTSLLSTVNEM